MPLVTPLAQGTSAEIDELARFFDETLGFTPNSVLTMQRRPAIACNPKYFESWALRRTISSGHHDYN